MELKKGYSYISNKMLGVGGDMAIGHYKVLFYSSTVADESNIFRIDGLSTVETATKMKIRECTVHAAVRELKKMGLIKKICKGVYMIDPTIALSEQAIPNRDILIQKYKEIPTKKKDDSCDV
jgi:predicted transcriptional regulator of viral defense system